MARKIKFEVGEYYHCYSRGVDKRRVFEDRSDAIRFQELLYLANNRTPVHRSAMSSYDSIYLCPQTEPLVSITAYALMSNYYHLILGEIREGGISTFMQKLGTAYTMYFNIKYARVGNLYVKPFRAKHLNSDRYFQRAIQYVHLNPAELFEPYFKQGVVRDMEELNNLMLGYEFSSLRDYHCSNSPTRSILGPDISSLVANVSIPQLLIEAQETYLIYEEELNFKATP